jgi:hypothetical protein
MRRALYPGFGPDFPQGTAKRCGKADGIVPNLTEAAFLIGRLYREAPAAVLKKSPVSAWILGFFVLCFAVLF